MITLPAASRFILIVAAAALIAGCVYQHKSNKLSYVLNTKYDVFDIKEDAALSFSNFVGYCMMQMKDPDDLRAQEALELIDLYISENGYRKVTTNEILKSRYVAQKTFLVSFGYSETFTDGEIEVALNLHANDRTGRKDVVFWSWQAKYEDYPLERRTIEPALMDIFKKEPIDWQRHDRLFPLLCAPSNVVETFDKELINAR